MSRSGAFALLFTRIQKEGDEEMRNRGRISARQAGRQGGREEARWVDGKGDGGQTGMHAPVGIDGVFCRGPSWINQ